MVPAGLLDRRHRLIGALVGAEGFLAPEGYGNFITRFWLKTSRPPC
jgi:hypothetical protein